MPSLDFEGRPIPIKPADTVAAALYRGGVRVFSRSFKYHRARGLYCLTGDCPNCLVTVDGEPAVRACMRPAVEGQRVVRSNGWPSADRDAWSVLWYVRRLLPVGFYYKTLVRPRAAWALAEPLIRRLAGLGHVPRGAAPAQRNVLNHHPDLMVVGGGIAGLSAALAAADAGQSVVVAEEGSFGERLAAGLQRKRIEALVDLLRAQKNVTLLERSAALGVYEGPLVPVDGPDLLHLVHPTRVVVATGGVERHPVFPGNDLVGVWLGRGAARLAGVHGLTPGRKVVFAGQMRESLEQLDALLDAGVQITAAVVPGSLARDVAERVPHVYEGEIVQAHGRETVRGVVVDSTTGRRKIACDAVVLSLGLVARDGLLRQAVGLPAVGAGEALGPGQTLEQAAESGRAAALGAGAATVPMIALPRAADAGFVCLCEDVEARDIADAWREGFRLTELLKRYTTATMGPCQGILCHDHLRAMVKARTGDADAVAPTTSRPPIRPIRIEDAAAGIDVSVEQRTALHECHLSLGARMEWAGAWKRPETYGDPLAEYWAVRRAVSLIDVGTLGKFLVAGPHATEFLERLYPCHVRNLAVGAVRYALLLGEEGYVIDDGVICSLGERGYYLTFSTAGADHAEAWLRYWIETWGLEVHVVNQTASVGALNLAGPRSRELLSRLCDAPLGNDTFPYAQSREIEVGGVSCRALRVGFLGELAYELHHSSAESVQLWNRLLQAGQDFEIRPHGLEALRLLRLEKGHILVGQDTDFDSTPAKLGLGWATKLDKRDFVGKTALERLSALPMRQQLVKLRFEGLEVPIEGTPLRVGDRAIGHLTSSRFSPVLGCGVSLGWVRMVDGAFPTRVRAGPVVGTVVTAPFYDPEGARLRA